MTKTNQEIKQDLIKSAWKQHYDKYNEIGALDSNGVIQIEDWRGLPKDINFTTYKNQPNSYYPISLLDIDDNRGWIRIEPDGSNLPEDGDYHFLNFNDLKDDGMNTYFYNPSMKNNFFKWFTHYRPKHKPFPMPLY